MFVFLSNSPQTVQNMNSGYFHYNMSETHSLHTSAMVKK